MVAREAEATMSCDACSNPDTWHNGAVRHDVGCSLRGPDTIANTRRGGLAYVGERVRVVAPESETEYAGEIGTVVALDPACSGGFTHEVRLGCRKIWFCADEIAAVLS